VCTAKSLASWLLTLTLVLAVQNLYGANTSFNAENTVYGRNAMTFLNHCMLREPKASEREMQMPASASVRNVPGRPATGSPLYVQITSPVCTPARSAGPPGCQPYESLYKPNILNKPNR
jgi:hypothetical protein